MVRSFNQAKDVQPANKLLSCHRVMWHVFRLSSGQPNSTRCHAVTQIVKFVGTDCMICLTLSFTVKGIQELSSLWSSGA